MDTIVTFRDHAIKDGLPNSWKAKIHGQPETEVSGSNIKEVTDKLFEKLGQMGKSTRISDYLHESA